ncbi:oxidoreductase [Planctomycetaceae bacterium SCGC AG-212-F19]|nr:oxidoreductase [Planctomycetaceae bacterium SCGC AG-212-F19]
MASSRREFLKTSATIAAAAVASHAHAAGADETLKVALIGCGGRGTGAATQALNADKNVKLVAMGDSFADRIEQSLAALGREKEIAGKVDVKPDKRFVGFDAYKQVIDSGVDVVLLATPPGFRPIHMKYAVEKGKHVFAEKPCAVDAPGVRSVLATAEEAKKKGLSLVAGLQMRYSLPHREIVKRVHGGAIGELRTIIANDYRGSIWVKPRQPDWTDMTYQMRNWYYFAWLSGDFNVEQHVHMLDVCAWLKNEYPVRAVGMGGRAVRQAPEFGHIYDHFSVTYEFADGCKFFAQCRQSSGCYNEIGAIALGSKGRADLGRRLGITTNEFWKYDGPQNSAVQTEHDELFASIRNGKPLNNGEYLAKSSLLAILGRMVCYTGQAITWEQALNSKEDLSPPAYTWDVKLPDPPVAMPGVTKFV